MIEKIFEIGWAAFGVFSFLGILYCAGKMISSRKPEFKEVNILISTNIIFFPNMLTEEGLKYRLRMFIFALIFFCLSALPIILLKLLGLF